MTLQQPIALHLTQATNHLFACLRVVPAKEEAADEGGHVENAYNQSGRWELRPDDNVKTQHHACYATDKQESGYPSVIAKFKS